MPSLLKYSLAAAAAGLAAVAHATPLADGATALDDYVAQEDDTYSYFDTGVRLNGTSLDGEMSWTGHVLNMTSQTWLDETLVNRPVWWHMLVVIVPDEVEQPDWGMMWITGSSNEGDVIPKASDEDIEVTAQLAMETGTVAAALFQVPNEHILFYSDPEQKQRGEDAIIAYGWNWFVTQEQDPQYLMRLPMTKAAVRALDTVEDYVSKELGNDIESWGVAGASKRGWTTWTTAAFENGPKGSGRVKAAIPVVMDLMHITDNIVRMFEGYNGGWSFALEDYYDQNFTSQLTNPNMTQLEAIVDPAAYLDRLTMEVMAVNSGNDEFFLGDNDAMWWDDLKAVNPTAKRVLLPNTEHSLATGIFEIIPAITVWFNTIQQDIETPSFDWTLDRDSGNITVTTSETPTHIHMWYSESFEADARRDFRLINADSPCKCGFFVDSGKTECLNLRVLWQSETLHETEEGSNTYVASREPVDGKWTAMFVDVEFNLSANANVQGLGAWPFGHYTTLESTTQMTQFPNTYPAADCREAEDPAVACKGVLV